MELKYYSLCTILIMEPKTEIPLQRGMGRISWFVVFWFWSIFSWITDEIRLAVSLEATIKTYEPQDISDSFIAWKVQLPFH